MSRPAEVPERAEEFSAIEWMRTKRSPSKLAPAAERVDYAIACPRCKTERAIWSGTIACAVCNLNLYWACTSLYAWEDTDA